MENLITIAGEINELIGENFELKRLNDLYRQQLIIIALNNKEKKEYEYEHLGIYDLNMVDIAVGFSGISLMNKENNKTIKSWEELPKRDRRLNTSSFLG